MRATIAIALLLLTGCAATRFVAYTCATSPRDCGEAVSIAAEHKVLAFVQSPCDGPGSNQPYLVSGWVREKDMNRLTVVCAPDCTKCRLEVRR